MPSTFGEGRIARKVGNARRVLEVRGATAVDRSHRYDAIILRDALDRIDELRGLLDRDGFFVIHDVAPHVIEQQGLAVVDHEDDRVLAYPVAAEIRARLRELTHLRAHAAQQDEGIAWLRNELALRNSNGSHALRRKVRNGAAAIKRTARAARVRIYSRVVTDVGRRLPQPLKNFIKRVWNPWPARQSVDDVPAIAPQLDGRETTTYDILCFSIIDWSFRWQRPQQMMARLANAGHRVFFLSTSEFLAPGSRTFQATPLRENVWEIRLAPPATIEVYSGRLTDAVLAWFPRMLEELRSEFGVAAAISVVQVATWTRAAEAARQRFGWKLVYDCMDEWNQFPGMNDALVREEERLAGIADLITVSGERLLRKWRERASNVVLVRNAADFDFFSSAPRQELLAGVPRPIAGYTGAIARWLDVELVRCVATARPDVTFVLVGGIFDVDVSSLERLPNVQLLGQQPYERMPSYLAAFDVCIIPFVVDEITAATDPVKFYEYVSLGKPVVATPMPELEPYRELLYTATSAEHFVQQLDVALREDDAALRERRIALARANTWSARVDTLRDAVRDLHVKVSIIVVTYFNIDLTRLCLDAVFRSSLHPNLEVIVVDNGSTDGTPAMLEELAREHANLRVILNDANRGFAAANNQGIAIATGDALVLLNNDTVPARGWLPRMLRHLENPEIGLVVAVTNFSGNESRIAVPYTTLNGMPAFAEKYARTHDGRVFDIAVAAMYCVGLRREVFARIGPLDEEFNVGMFEDDDYSHRTRLAGLRVVCAEDVFVHHFGQASFGKLPHAEYQAIWKRNQAHYERKWGMRWEPHTYR
jgi:GT2 family glycosyltransferase/glycosyltransferase involved in cell wall biosynthesis